MCITGLAGVQQLYERWKGRSDRAVLMIAMDATAAIAESSVKANGYSFRSSTAWTLTKKSFQAVGGPRSG
jgi:hypothetical protein